MAKHEDDFSFDFSSMKPCKQPDDSADASAEDQGAAAQREQPDQFRILILADFSGRTNRRISEPAAIATRKVHKVDVDTLEAVLARLKPEIHLPVSDTAVLPLIFKSMSDFRPDALLQQNAAFQGLLNLRVDLKDPGKFPETAAKVRLLTGAAPTPPKASEPAPADGGSDFERLLNQTVAPKNAGPVDTQSMIENLVAGYSVPAADPEQGKLIALLEDALSAGLRAVLRHPAFQAVEATWRGVEFLTTRLNTDEELKLCILDVSKEELFADLTGTPTLQKSGLDQILVEQMRAPGAVPFSLVVGDYEFDSSPEDIALLARLASLMHEAGAPLIAGAAPRIAGVPSFDQFPDAARWQSPPAADLALWDKLRAHPHAASLGLAAPRFLLRLPYGPKTDAIDTYPFEEMPGTPVPEGYLWGNGAVAVALGIGEGFLESGWEFQPGTDITDLPCHMAMVDGDQEMTPCAQGWHSDRVGDILHQLGLIPLLSVRNAAAVKIAGIHSLAKGGQPLAASWASS